MSIITKIRDKAGAGIQNVVTGFKAASSNLRFPGMAHVFFDLVRTSKGEMAAEIGSGTGSDVLMTPVIWLQNAIAEAPIIAQDAAGDPIENSGLVELLKTPNPFYSSEVLLAGTTLSIATDGNAYWVVVDSKGGKEPAELWYAPHMNMTPSFPRDDSTKFITHYVYEVQGEEQLIRPFGVEAGVDGVPADVVEGLSVIQFRKGIDPDNLRLGLSPIKGLLREIWTDNEAAAFTAAMLKNNGVPGVVISPANNDATLTPEEGKAIEAKIDTKFKGEGRGRVMVSLGATKVEQFGFSPAEMDLSAIRNMSEERVTAALGVPAAVVGFGSGLESTKVGATMDAMVTMAWSQGVIPIQKIIAGELSRTLAPVFGAVEAVFDNKGVQALRENEDLKAARIGRLYRDGVIMRSEARSKLDFESVPADEVYLSNLSTTFVGQGQTVEPTNGNGAEPKGRKLDEGWLMNTPGGVVELRTGELRKEAPPAEQRIIAAAPQADPLPIAVRMSDRLAAIRERAPSILAPLLERAFSEFGDAAELAARRTLDDIELVWDSFVAEQKGAELPQEWNQKRAELSPQDMAIAADIFSELDIENAKRSIQAALEAGFLEVSIEVSGAMTSTFGIEFALEDAAQQRVLNEAGLRLGLIDLDAQTRDALFDALAEGRAEGKAGDNLARLIRDKIEAGPWRDVETRALVIARSEGAHAANVSTLEGARAMPDTEHVQIFDDRLGDGDEQCATANGKVVTIQEAEAIGLCHPNGTRAFVPINAVLMEEMGL